MRGQKGLYPAVSIAHVAGLVMLVGGIGVVDLRTIGLGRGVPLPALSRFLTPLAIAGLVLMAASGLMLFSADAGPLSRSPVFRTKVVLIAVALANALIFRRLFGDFEHGREPPALARIMALGSLGLWSGAAVLGRLIAYS